MRRVAGLGELALEVDERAARRASCQRAERVEVERLIDSIWSPKKSMRTVRPTCVAAIASNSPGR